MSIAIIISTHGLAAKHLLKTTEMILGKQDNVACVDFISGENTDILIEKYTAQLVSLNTTEGMLFLVDIWGGSPFNAASRIVINKKNHEIVTGINIPMLIEIFMVRDDQPIFQKIVDVAVKSGQCGIKVLNVPPPHAQSILITEPTIISPDYKYKQAAVNQKKGEHMIIGLARIDDRLIHGQVVTSWIREANIKRIIVVSDEVAADTVRKTLLTQVAPPGVIAHVVDIAKAIRVYNNPKYANERVMLLFTNPTDVVRLVDGGVAITSVNIGGMAFHQGKTQVNNAVSVDSKDIEAFKKLNEYNIELEVRKVSSDSPLKMMELIKKFDN